MKKSGCLSLFLKILGGLFLLSVVILAGIAVYNRTLPDTSPLLTKLSEEEQVRIREINHLRNELGDEVWPGWSDQAIPILLYNEGYAFLTGIQDPAPGWVRVPYGTPEGAEWEHVSGADYYRQQLPFNGVSPQAFIVRIGDTFAASMTTKAWTSIHMVELIKSELPGPLKPVFPYFVFTNQFNSDWYVSAVLHESFHVLQARYAYERLEESERATALESEYPWENEEFRALWLEEREVLAEALGTVDIGELRERVNEWVDLRRERRKQMPVKLVRYEQRREWLEGLAKYAEIAIWQVAHQSPDYEPVPGMTELSDFDCYREAPEYRNREISQLQSDLQFSESMFYYTGWAQAELLDRLDVTWKERIMDGGVYLDELLEKL